MIMRSISACTTFASERVRANLMAERLFGSDIFKPCKAESAALQCVREHIPAFRSKSVDKQQFVFNAIAPWRKGIPPCSTGNLSGASFNPQACISKSALRQDWPLPAADDHRAAFLNRPIKAICLQSGQNAPPLTCNAWLGRNEPGRWRGTIRRRPPPPACHARPAYGWSCGVQPRLSLHAGGWYRSCRATRD